MVPVRFGLVILALSKTQKAKLEMVELNIFSLGVTRMDKIRDKHIRGTTKVRL